MPMNLEKIMNWLFDKTRLTSNKAEMADSKYSQQISAATTRQPAYEYLYALSHIKVSYINSAFYINW